MAKKREKNSFQDFIKIIRRLRKDCPWDREQTHRSIRNSLIEESYEAVEAIDKNDLAELKRELGDLLLQVVMHSIMAEEKGAFRLEDVISSESEKMIRRHPHVFHGTIVRDSQEVKRNWEHIKLKEGRKSVIDGVPVKMPGLLRALRIQEKASKVGFDWKKKRDVWKKVVEEMNEFIEAERSRKKPKMEEELGDFLFAIVNYSRFVGINPELALKNAIGKFNARFHRMEQELERKGIQIGTVTLKEMDEIWNAKKKLEK